MNPKFFLLLFAPLLLQACESTSSKLAQRSFEFQYEATVKNLPADAEQVKIWIPVPVDDEAQTITDLKIDTPHEYKVGKEEVYGNQMVYVSVSKPFPQEIPIRLSMNVQRSEVKAMSSLAGNPERSRLLRGDQQAPLNDAAKSRATIATSGMTTTDTQARGIYDLVLKEVDYDKSGQGWGKGNLDYVCDVGKGNCSDFHTLFIAMARSSEIPSVFEIGFPLPKGKAEGTIGGYHCWAWFEDQKDSTWRPVDASEADKDPSMTEYFFGTICENRVAFSRGRDLLLVPAQSEGPINFFVYPHVEVDGKAGVATIEKKFTYKDI